MHCFRLWLRLGGCSERFFDNLTTLRALARRSQSGSPERSMRDIGHGVLCTNAAAHERIAPSSALFPGRNRAACPSQLFCSVCKVEHQLKTERKSSIKT